MLSKVKEVAAVFELKIGERFKIKGKDAAYWFDMSWGLVCEPDDTYKYEPNEVVLHRLITGEYLIERKCGLNE